MNSFTQQAVNMLKNGKVISFPTETVYALAANAFDDNAINKIYALKGREFNKPLAIMFADINMAKKYVVFNDNALKIAHKFCPGEISLVLPKRKDCKIPAIVNSAKDTLSIRIPNFKIALDILNEIDFPIVATSVNPSGKNAAATSDEVLNYFPTGIDYIIEGKCPSGQSSTIIDLTYDKPKILREGKITFEDIKKAL